MDLQQIYVENVLDDNAKVIEENEHNIDEMVAELERLEREIREARIELAY